MLRQIFFLAAPDYLNVIKLASKRNIRKLRKEFHLLAIMFINEPQVTLLAYVNY